MRRWRASPTGGASGGRAAGGASATTRGWWAIDYGAGVRFTVNLVPRVGVRGWTPSVRQGLWADNSGNAPHSVDTAGTADAGPAASWEATRWRADSRCWGTQSIRCW